MTVLEIERSDVGVTLGVVEQAHQTLINRGIEIKNADAFRFGYPVAVQFENFGTFAVDIETFQDDEECYDMAMSLQGRATSSLEVLGRVYSTGNHVYCGLDDIDAILSWGDVTHVTLPESTTHYEILVKNPDAVFRDHLYFGQYRHKLSVRRYKAAKFDIGYLDESVRNGGRFIYVDNDDTLALVRLTLGEELSSLYSVVLPEEINA